MGRLEAMAKAKRVTKKRTFPWLEQTPPRPAEARAPRRFPFPVALPPGAGGVIEIEESQEEAPPVAGNMPQNAEDRREIIDIPDDNDSPSMS
jgi:hypothetical protein